MRRGRLPGLADILASNVDSNAAGAWLLELLHGVCPLCGACRCCHTAVISRNLIWHLVMAWLSRSKLKASQQTRKIVRRARHRFSALYPLLVATTQNTPMCATSGIMSSSVDMTYTMQGFKQH